MKAIITSAGLGTRMRPITYVMPKALLPLFKKEDGRLAMVPIIESILESLSSAGASDFCMVVGEDGGGVLKSYLAGNGITFVVQKTPKGFGDAVLTAERFAGDEPVFVHADDGVLTGGYAEALALFREKDADGVLLLRRVDNPQRYGVALGSLEPDFMGHKVMRLTEVAEKPKEPKSNFAMLAAYVFKPCIFQGLRNTKSHAGEVELTPGIQSMIEDGKKVYAILLESEKWLNVGDPDNYYKALAYTYQNRD